MYPPAPPPPEPPKSNTGRVVAMTALGTLAVSCLVITCVFAGILFFAASVCSNR